VTAFVKMLMRRLSPDQRASAAEEWELICEQNAWSSAVRTVDELSEG
jgi:hypothetical protein